MSQPVRTVTAKQIIEALDQQVENATTKLADLRAIDLDEESTQERQRVRLEISHRSAHIEAFQLAQGIVRGLLPYVEVDAVQRAMPGVSLSEAEFLLGEPAVDDKVDDPSDPSLPFVVEFKDPVTVPAETTQAQLAAYAVAGKRLGAHL